MDLAGLNFSDFAFTCSINSKYAINSNISGYNFYFLAKMGQFANFQHAALYGVLNFWAL